MSKSKVSFTEAFAQAAETGDDRYAVVMRHGTLSVGLYAPVGADPQAPHSRDELYVVVRGAGEFVSDGERTPFGVGDVLVAPAGVVHRFEDFTDDLSVWVVFYGPEGGEAPFEDWF